VRRRIIDVSARVTYAPSTVIWHAITENETGTIINLDDDALHLSATLTVPAFMKNVFLNLDLNFCYCCLVLTKLYTMLDVCFELLRDQQPKKARTETEMISELKSELKRLKSCNCKLN
jgi:hypothetical protein